MTPPSTPTAVLDATTSIAEPTEDTEPSYLSRGERMTLAAFVVVPFVALLAAVPLAWGGWLGWSDVVITVVMYTITGLGITAGFHRLFTHKAFKPNRAVKIGLAIAGSMAIEGPVIRWVADHRKHHKFSDRDGDPHSPWRYGENVPALLKGMVYAHIGWMFDGEQTPQRKYAPDLMKDPDILRISRLFPVWVAVSMIGPAIAGGLWTMSWQGALTAFFWATLVRIALLHHVTWAINSICHTIGEQPFRSRDHSGNVWWLAIPSFGESWHNLHHADPTCARHGVLKGQVDISARTIRIFEQLGWVKDVRWPVAERLAARRQPVAGATTAR
ncbi:MAG: Stearoyl-CoA 9-desaturase [Nocardioidaceae bacterium]|jgi:stearoyl-CoA desaturase (delta-9 desaturase)|nr:Stearoyl-CoA 9-desaturase [Nocardioidaceae bacterium]